MALVSLLFCATVAALSALSFPIPPSWDLCFWCNPTPRIQLGMEDEVCVVWGCFVLQALHWELKGRMPKASRFLVCSNSDDGKLCYKAWVFKEG